MSLPLSWPGRAGCVSRHCLHYYFAFLFPGPIRELGEPGAQFKCGEQESDSRSNLHMSLPLSWPGRAGCVSRHCLHYYFAFLFPGPIRELGEPGAQFKCGEQES